MHAMSHKSGIFHACSSGVNISEPALYFTIMLLWTVSQVYLPSIQIPTMNWDSESSNTLLLEVIISSKNYCVLVCDFGNLMLQIIFVAMWTSINVGWKCPIAWNNSGHELLWKCYLHCAMEETANPAIICITSHQVPCHLSEYVASSMGKTMLDIVYIAKLNTFTESKVTELTMLTGDVTTVAILKMQGSWGIIIVSVQSKFIFHI